MPINVTVTAADAAADWIFKGGDTATDNGTVTVTDASSTAPATIRFTLTNNDAYSWAATPCTWKEDASAAGFTVNAPNGATFTVEDTDADGTVAGVAHSYNLHVTKKADSTAHSSDPQIVNKRSGGG